MNVTDEQAKDMWCPFARVAFVGQNVMNRVSSFYMELAKQSADRGDTRDLEHYQRQERDTHCIGSRCMAWRVTSIVHITGYCGLSGKPTEFA